MTDRPKRTYLAIDLKSFYASAECAALGLDPLQTNLVVADVSRTEKTICLAVSPSLKAYGLPGRARLFEVIETMNRVNEERRLRAPGRRFVGESCDARELAANPRLKAGYIAAKPRMSYYLQTSASIYTIYLRYASANDIHVYSIDEVFIDVTHYLGMYRMTPHELARRIVQDIVDVTGITATAGIGTNMYLAKVAMDIVAKHMPADRDGVRVAELDEASYRRLLWEHRPLTDFWRVGRGYARRLESAGLLTMGDIAHCSTGRASDYYNEDLLYRMFGVNAELLIDHAWGWEPCEVADIKAYRPAENSLSSGQVLHRPYPFASARLVTREMADAISLELVEKGLVTRQIGLYIGYEGREGFEGSAPVSTNRYGKKVPRPANGSADLGEYTSSTRVITAAMMDLYDRIVDRDLMVRRINVVVGRLRPYADDAAGVSNADRVTDGAGDGVDVAAVTCDGDAAGDVANGTAMMGLSRDDVRVTGATMPSARGVSGRRRDCGGATMPIRPVGHAEQLDLFTDVEDEDHRRSERQADQRREHDVQQALIAVKQRFGKNAVLKAMNLEPDATGRDRNNQIGGHAAGTDRRDDDEHKEKRPDATRDHIDTGGSGDRNGNARGAISYAAPPLTIVKPIAVRKVASTLQPTHRYDDIIDLPHHRSVAHPHMARANRAAQFMPFAALAGYDDVLLDSLAKFEQTYAPRLSSPEDALNHIC